MLTTSDVELKLAADISGNGLGGVWGQGGKTSILVQDAIFLVTVPNICTDTPILERMPVVAYVGDSFQKPQPFSPDVVVDIDDVMERKLDMVHCHVSQLYEWLPFNGGHLDEVPEGEEERKTWMAARWSRRFVAVADAFRELLIERYGEERGEKVRYAEAFEGCEYGSALSDENIPILFPF